MFNYEILLSLKLAPFHTKCDTYRTHIKYFKTTTFVYLIKSQHKQVFKADNISQNHIYDKHFNIIMEASLAILNSRHHTNTGTRRDQTYSPLLKKLDYFRPTIK